MKNNMIDRVAGSLLALMFGLLISAAPATAQSAESSPLGGHKLVGLWNVQVTIRNCADGTPQASFPSMAKFEYGGTMTNQDVANIRTPVPGVWSYGGKNNYEFAFKSFIFDNGTYTGYLVVRQDLIMGADDNSFTSDGTVSVFTPAGQQVGGGCSTTVGQRFE